MKIYLAGPMPEDPDHGDHPWRLDYLNPHRRQDVHFLSPFLAGCDHRGVAPQETVRVDLDLVAEADGVLAYIDAPDRVGTLIEVGVAIGLGKPVVLVVTSALHDIPRSYSGHTCECSWEDFGWPWFAEASVHQHFILPSNPNVREQEEVWTRAFQALDAAIRKLPTARGCQWRPRHMRAF